MSAFKTAVLLFLAAILCRGAATNSLGHSPSQLKKFDLVLTWEDGKPDGVARKMIFINGEYPGPPLLLSQGDDVEVVVKNLLPFGTTIHMHGIQQFGTPWSDGVPGVTQKLIREGESFTYRWTATDYGTYWYHCHSKGLLADGCYGPIHITPNDNVESPFHLITNETASLASITEAVKSPTLVMLSDWNHFTSPDIRDIAVSANVDPLCSHSILVNGKGAVNCLSPNALAALITPISMQFLGGMNLTATGCLPLSPYAQGTTTHHFELLPPQLFSDCNATNSPMEVIEADPRKGWISLNFIASTTEQELTVSIDSHPMVVYAMDGNYINPVQVDAAMLSHGSRYSVLVKLDQKSANYTIRVASTGANQVMSGFAVLSYMNGANLNTTEPFIDYGGKNTTAGVRFLNTTTLVPYPNIPPAPIADATFIFALERIDNAWTWSVDNSHPFGSPLEEFTPVLVAPWTAENTTTIWTKNGTWVDLILVALGNGTGNPSHPMHKHNSKAYLLGQGQGNFNYSTVEEAMVHMPGVFNLNNPPMADSFYTPPAGGGVNSFLVIRYQVVNPMPTFFHCHINPHVEGGMGVVIFDGAEDLPPIPEEYLIAAQRS